MRIRSIILAVVVCCITDATWLGSNSAAFLRGGADVTTSQICFVASQSVPTSVREKITHALKQDVSQPKDCWDAVNTNAPIILFRPDIIDLQRKEGLWELLGPMMEQILAARRQTPTLIVLCDNIPFVQETLEQASLSLIRYLSHAKDERTLSDVFANIHYVTTPQEAMQLANTNNDSTALSKKQLPSESLKMIPQKINMTPANLAAARRLGVDARRTTDETLETVRRATTGDDGRMKMVMNFGDLCRACLKNAQLPPNPNPVAQQMASYIQNTLEHAFVDLYEQQMVLLEQAVFEEFRGKLSNLKITNNLPSDMEKVAQTFVQKFAQAARRMAVPGATPPTTAFRRRLTEYISERLLKAQATNKFRPLPRKGVTVGFHWLLPKPFGNDYRQEPWKVHATDNMVYVPGAVADVNPVQVEDGTWRDAIVPLPSGKDMLYMQ